MKQEALDCLCPALDASAAEFRPSQWLIRLWKPEPAPQWVACVPSLSRPELVPDFAERLAGALSIPFSAFAREKKVYKPCLLVDDMVDSRWTFTVLSALLRMNGVQAVHPLALALTASGDA